LLQACRKEVLREVKDLKDWAASTKSLPADALKAQNGKDTRYFQKHR